MFAIMPIESWSALSLVRLHEPGQRAITLYPCYCSFYNQVNLMLPLINIGLRAARMANEQVVRSVERLDIIHDEGQDLNEYLRKLCQNVEKKLAFYLIANICFFCGCCFCCVWFFHACPSAFNMKWKID